MVQTNAAPSPYRPRTQSGSAETTGRNPRSCRTLWISCRPGCWSFPLPLAAARRDALQPGWCRCPRNGGCCSSSMSSLPVTVVILLLCYDTRINGQKKNQPKAQNSVCQYAERGPAESFPVMKDQVLSAAPGDFVRALRPPAHPRGRNLDRITIRKSYHTSLPGVKGFSEQI